MPINTKIDNLESKEYYKLLSDIYHDVARSATLKDALLKLVNVTTYVIKCERGSIFLNDSKTKELYSFIAQGNLEHEIRMMNDTGLAGWSFINDQHLKVKDAYKDKRHNQFIDDITGYKTKSVLCVPLKDINNKLIGVTQMLNKIDGEFTDLDIEIVKALTEHAALAIQSKITIASVEEAHKKELEFLEAITRVSSEIQLPLLLEKIINTITKSLDSERATLFINDFKTNELYTEASIGLEKREIRFPNHIGLAGSVFQSGEIINIPHAYADLRFNPSFDRSTGYFTRSILSAPVVNKKGTVIGVTQVLNKKHGTFNDDDISQLTTINSQISMAIENAKLFDDVQTIKNYNESILESMTNSVLTINEDNIIVTCNRAGVKLLGMKHNEIINSDAITFFNQYSDIIANKLKNIINNNDTLKQETIFDIELTNHTVKATVNTSIVPLFNLIGDNIGIMLILEDITNEKRMKSTMSRYMSPDLTEKLLSSSDFSLGGTSSLATILFSDIRNFTSITEKLGPIDTVNMLNEYFSLMVDCIQKNDGILDKFIGDAIMAVFGSPFHHDDDPDRAVKSAIEMMKALNLYNMKRNKLNLSPIVHGIGINTDTVVSGNIGSEKRMDFTVIGDGVNLASRVESLCKSYGTGILVSEFTFNQLKSTYRSRLIDKVIVKGKNNPVTIYEILDYIDQESFPNLIDALGYFSNGITYYFKKEWDKAIAAFNEVLKINPNDKPSSLYLDRCRELKMKGCDQDWNGVWVMKHK